MAAPTVSHGAPHSATPLRAEPASGRALAPWAVLGFCGSLAMALFGTRVGSIPEPASVHWWFWLPGGRSPGWEVVFYLGFALLVAGWIGVGSQARRSGLSTRQAVALLASWALPMLLGPPLFSRDLYSYVGQGLVAHRGLNPYTVAPAVLGHGPLLSSIASVWRHTTSPYGPLFVLVTRGVASVVGTSVVAEVLALRALEVAGVVLIVVFLPRLARQLGADPGLALWLGVLSPLSLIGMVASGHNDALMLGGLVAGVSLAVDGRFAWAVLVCALAATIKLPAAAAIVFLAADRLSRRTGVGRLRTVVEASAITAGTLAVVTLVAGYGWTWLGPTALHVPTELRVLTTPSVSLGVLVFHAAHLVGLSFARSTVVTVAQDVVAALGASAVVWLLVTVRRHEVVGSLGLALLVVVLASPTVWPWYLLWGLVLLAATTAQRSRLLGAVAALAMLLVGPSGTPRLVGPAYLLVSLAVVIGIVWSIRAGSWRNWISGDDG
ncbi:MAG: polyprenol phosphomannose-dependent alpha 1,6 mannosyltransferase MptB [Acidimicrobiales bacterium]